MKSYDHKHIDAKWQKQWADDKRYRVSEDTGKDKCYVLDMFPYPSGEGLHVGHPKGYIATDVYARYKTMQGKNVLHPMGWDAFGLPAENFAIKNKVHPRQAVDTNVARFKEQLEKIGFTYDWDREINTTDPEYYKWTQWAFIQMFKKGLAYESYEPINWCPSCKTGLANEDLDGNKCERCDSIIEQKPMRQWVLKITDYAERLLADLDDLPWSESVKLAQRNWIGKSEGALLRFPIVIAPIRPEQGGRYEEVQRETKQSSTKPSVSGTDPRLLRSARSDGQSKIEVFTTRPDTLYGATYVVLAPEHALVADMLEQGTIANADEVRAYIEAARMKTEIDRTAADKEKTGVKLEGVMAVNPANQEEVPIYIADYVLSGYGTGAIMAVPSHDERDFAFAKKYGLPVHSVVVPPSLTSNVLTVKDVAAGSTTNVQPATSNECWTLPGELTHSGPFTGMDSEEAKAKITEHAGGTLTTQYRLQDWVFSRQRYWGEPIPIIHCEKCGAVPVPEDQLPVKLPDVESYEPTGTGESPLANIEEWVNTTCPNCGGAGKRETNTMPQWAGSSWYYLRYMDPHNSTELVAKDKERYWAPVDVYVGGMEHATRHLIYARFWHKFLQDIGVVSTAEPFQKLYTVGLINAEDGRKMSKRWGNVVNPDDVIENIGADALRVYEMFMGPFEQAIAWSTDQAVGARRFLEKVYGLEDLLSTDTEATLPEDVALLLHQTIEKVGKDIGSFSFNTAISQMMILVNALEKLDAIPAHVYESLIRILAPFAPHLTEELWQSLGHKESVHTAPWPEYDEAVLAAAQVTITVQVNGKVRDTFTTPPNTARDTLITKARECEKAATWLKGKEVKKEVVVPDRLVNFVV